MPVVQGSDHDDSGGKAFEGIKFWVSHRVPSRANILETIKANGGVIEPLDKRADLLIADHARKDAPPGSFSWRLVVESDKAGRLVDKEPHLIGRPVGQPRPVASHEPARHGRVPFSAADDVILASWAHGKKSDKGNALYKELEAAHPHHSWQSWRDRWVKRLRNLPPDVLDQMASSNDSNSPASHPPATNGTRAQQQAPGAPATNGPRPQRQATPPSQQAQQSAPVQPPPPLRQLPPAEREKSPGFDDNDDALLERHVKAKVESGERWNGMPIYEELSEQHPHHSARSWKQRFATLWEENVISMKSWNSRGRTTDPQPDTTSSTDARPQIQHNDIPPAEGDAASEDGAVFSSQQSNHEANDQKVEFYSDLTVWHETEAMAGRTWDVAKFHRIQRRTFEIWDLYEAVVAQKCNVDSVDWGLVAERLGFPWVGAPHTSELLEECWDKYLARFHEDTAGFEDAVATDDDDGDNGSAATEGVHDDLHEEHVAVTKGGHRSPSDARIAMEEATNDLRNKDVTTPRRGHRSPIPSNPPTEGADDGVADNEYVPMPSRRRPSPSLSDRAIPISSRKKRRLGRNAEIQSTPEAELRPGPRPRADSPTPSKRVRISGGRDVDSRINPGEDIYNTTSTPQRSLPQEANVSPPTVRLRDHRGSATSKQTRPSGGHTTRGRPAPAPASSSDSPPLSRRRPSLATSHEPESESRPLRDNGAEEPAGEEDNSREVIAAVNNFIQQGYTREVVVEALIRTSMDVALSRRVMEILKAGGEVPDDERGVWTIDDDERLEKVNSVDMNQPTENLTKQRRKRQLQKMWGDLVKKHGEANVEARKRFLVDMKKAESGE
ncbi:uncharacterized protein DNG_05364 [Cephalotrichum gorgonifer]|uniref:DNA-binding protein RAP1 n=1 Tax=Cephalotrichum gorgonifer TaxID=2041049 RepID=A0AAE8MXS5_9PEZI|nr:uncharacterized protein DNG_05364 [Cephalotrichum gorgonifer]